VFQSFTDISSWPLTARVNDILKVGEARKISG